MRFAQFLKKLRLYGFDTLLLGLFEKILEALIKYAVSTHEKLTDKIKCINEKRAAKG